MRKKTPYILLLLLFVSCYVQAAGPNTLVGTYYYPWYDNTSFHGGSPTGDTTIGYHLEPTQVQPALGWYDQDNASVITQHYEWAEYAGIDFFVCSYWGRNSGEDDIIRARMFNNPDRGDIKLCVFLEPRLTPAGNDDEEPWNDITPEEMTAEMDYLCDNYFDHPSYLYIDGKPVVFIYITRAMSATELTLCLDTFRTAASNKGYPELYIAGDEVWGSPSTSIDGPRVSQLDGITNYDVYGNNSSTPFVTDAVLNTWQIRNGQWKDLADDYGTDMIPAISPGYNDRSVRGDLTSSHWPCSRKLNNESNEFGSLFTGMIDRLEPVVGMIMINSWNEWHEDTQIEPTTVAAPTALDDGAITSYYAGWYTEGVYHEGYGMRYLDILRDQFVAGEIPIGASAFGDNPPDETADNAFDGDDQTKWLDYSMIVSGSSYIQWRYAVGAAPAVIEYAITSANDTPARDPMDWNLLGSNDGGIIWDTLDSRTGETFPSRFQRRVFSVSNIGTYEIYRLEITDIADFASASSVQLAEFELIGDMGSPCAGPADLNCNGIVDLYDFSYMAGVWLTSDPTADIALPADGMVGLPDLLVLVQEWLSDSLVDGAAAYWKLDETAGSVASDYSENGYDGTLINMDDSDWVGGNTGNGLDFDGVDDHVDAGDVCAAIAGRNVTVSAWMKAAALNPAVQFIIAINSSTGDNKLMFGTQANTATLSFADSEPVWRDTTATVIDNTWHHIAYVLNDSSDTVTIYVDGSEALSFTSAVSIAATDLFSLGQEYDAGLTTGDFYSGQLDDVRVYGYALNETEIGRLYNPSGLFAHWKLDETTGALAADESANGYDGTLVNMDDSDWVAGNTGNGLDFDGVNDYVDAGGVCAAMAGKDVTVSAWVKAPVVNPVSQFIISINTSTGDNRLLCGTQPGSDTFSLGDTAWHDTAATVIDNTWHHIAYVLEDSYDTITVYVDGSEALSFTSTVSVAADDILSFGQEYDPGMTTGDFYNGMLDDVRIYDYALSEAEIAGLAQ
ncbi:MAG: glycoside hydrolase family 99-like domain-containing protein [Planctomycetes bacterium]|nr:glycoside hydrolase family 99-like domain-containing protein [Planctomycetota bacterium]